MPRPKGRTTVLTPSQLEHALAQTEHHRYPEKNKAILLMSFSMGLTAQEIARLRIMDIADVDQHCKSITLLNHMSVHPKKQSTPHDDEMRNSHKGFNIDKEQFNGIIRRVAADASNGQPINVSDYYPEKQRYQRALRILPLYCLQLRDALVIYFETRIKLSSQSDSTEFSKEPLFVNQKKNAYSQNTLQEHMKLMLAVWAGISGATSLSGRMTLTHKMLDDGASMRDVQQFLGHVSASTTVLHKTPNNESGHLAYDLRTAPIFNHQPR
jgi:site-specific recombinase XerD